MRMQFSYSLKGEKQHLFGLVSCLVLRIVMAFSEQDEGDASIVWENPETPASAGDYIFVHGKRIVRPYYFEFVAHVKKRWAGKIIVDVYAQEFKGRPPEYYVQAVERGRILVGGRRVEPSFVVRDSQKMSHFVHRHEPPVMAEPVKILEEGPDIITVCKPPSIPVHPCGQYRKNTVVGILEAEHHTGQLFPIHRLDRLVSGLLILARNAQTANLFREEIEGGRVCKQYVAKVKGVFPAHEVEVNAAIVYDAREGISRVETGQDGAVKSKAACTRFRRLSTNGVCSIVDCKPVTGRTHQIRVHLQYLGHPIANDDLYLQAHPPKRSMGDFCRRDGGKPAEEMLHRHNKKDARTSDLNADGCMEPGNCASTLTDPAIRRIETGGHIPLVKVPQEKSSGQTESDGQQFSADILCTHCPNLEPSGYKMDEDGLWLHCVRYSSPLWTYECPLPEWAQ